MNETYEAKLDREVHELLRELRVFVPDVKRARLARLYVKRYVQGWQQGYAAGVEDGKLLQQVENRLNEEDS